MFAPTLTRDLARRALFHGVACLVLLVSGFVCLAPAQDRRQRQVSLNTAAVPSVVVESDVTTVTRCPERADEDTTRVRLVSRTENLSGNVSYTYTTTGGRITGTGANRTWDLTGVQPGVYTATVEAENDLADLGCRAFSSTVVVVRDCPPLVVQCPAVNVLAPETVRAGEPLTFVANVSGPGGVVPAFNWNVSGGTIMSGQGTPTITVDTASAGGTSVRAAVQLAGYDASCSARAEASAPVTTIPVARRFDEFPSINFDDDKARLDNLAVELQNDPTARGFIIVYPGVRARADQASRLGARARDYLTRTRGIDASRLTVTSGAPRERAMYELYIVPLGAQPPTVGR